MTRSLRQVTAEDRNRVEEAIHYLAVTGPLAVRSALDRRLPPELARLASEQVALRRAARGRLDGAERMWLTRKGLEQASRRSIARERARRIASRYPSGTVLDATAGIGGDALELARAGLCVVAADADAEHASAAGANLGRTGHRPWAIVARAEAPACRADAVVIDPDRRAGGDRSLDPREWSPPLDAALVAAARFGGACLKLAPAFDPARIGGLDRPHAWEWVSDGGELIELTLWLGELAGDARGRRTAVRIDGDAPAVAYSAEPLEIEPLGADEAAGIAWLAEPDPALIRSGLLGAHARELGLAPLGPRIAFLGGPREPESPLLRCWRVVESAPADPRAVRAMLARHDTGACDVLRRGHPASTAELERMFRGRGERRGLLAVTRLARGHRAYLLELVTRA